MTRTLATYLILGGLALVLVTAVTIIGVAYGTGWAASGSVTWGHSAFAGSGSGGGLPWPIQAVAGLILIAGLIKWGRYIINKDNGPSTNR